MGKRKRNRIAVGASYRSETFAQRAKATYIVHLAQVHIAARIGDIAGGLHSDHDAIARSQFEILRHIQRAPDAPVFLEGLTSPLTFESRLVQAAIQNGAEHFCDGLSANFDALSNQQKLILGVSIAPVLAFALGWIKTVLPTTNAGFEQNLVIAIENAHAVYGSLDAALAVDDSQSGLRRMIFAERENLALANIYEWLSNNENYEGAVYLVFGAHHKFKAEQRIDTVPPLAA